MSRPKTDKRYNIVLRIEDASPLQEVLIVEDENGEYDSFQKAKRAALKQFSVIIKALRNKQKYIRSQNKETLVVPQSIAWR